MLRPLRFTSACGTGQKGNDAMTFQQLCCCLLVCATIFSLFSCPLAGAADKTEEQILQELLQQREDRLWTDANDALLAGKEKEAAQFFLRFYRKFPDSSNTETALWQAATLHRNLALSDSGSDWGSVKDLFRLYTVEYPESAHLADAYFGVGDALYNMGYYRESLTYFGLFLSRFPDSPLANQVLYMNARAFLKIGRTVDAANAYNQLSLSKDVVFSLRGKAGQGHIFFYKDQFHDALAIYLKILRENPSFYLDDADLLRNKGIASLRVGNSREGRENLLQYLNMTGVTPFRLEVLFELAESYTDDEDLATGRKFYNQIVDEGDDEDRVVILSRFRLARQQQEAADSIASEEMGADLKDKPFQDVLDRQYQDPLSQDARFDMTKRYWQRKDFDQAYTMGKSYLRYKTVEGEKAEIISIMGQVLIKRIEALFAKKDYQAIYTMYQDEYPYIKEYKGGELLFLVGRALEEMSLFHQAGAVYYRAVALDLTDEGKVDLYIHRAQSYLADNDLKAAQRLLKYVRKIYASHKALGEFCSLSGHLREMQNRPEDAVKFYQIAVESPTFAEKKNKYAVDYLRLLFSQDMILQKAGILDRFRHEKWLKPAELQHWYGKLAEKYSEANSLSQARDAYLAAVSPEMPQDNDAAQEIHLKLGDVLTLMGNGPEAVLHFQQALSGKNQIVKKMAQLRLDQGKIDQSMEETEAVLNN